MTTPPVRRRPAVFRLDDPLVEAREDLTIATAQEAIDPALPAVAGIAHPAGRRFPFGRIAVAALLGLASLSAGMAVDDLLSRLFARSDWLGWVGVGCLALVLVSLAILIGRELLQLFRLKRIAGLRLQADRAIAANDRAEAQAVATALVALYAARPETAEGRRSVAAHAREIMDGADLVRLAERDLVLPLDRVARAAVSGAAKRVSVVTAVSPRAFLDVAFVAFEAVKLVRRVSTVYGGRPGSIGLFRLVGASLSHLAVTGSIAIGDTLLQQVLGQGVAARVSAKLGEGVVNGLMTARIGLAAIEVCRPLPFASGEAPRLADLTADLFQRPAREVAG